MPRRPGMCIDPKTRREDGTIPVHVRQSWTHWNVKGKPHYHVFYDCGVSLAEIDTAPDTHVRPGWRGLRECPNCAARG